MGRRNLIVARLFSAWLLTMIGQLPASAQFTTIINVPPRLAPQTVPGGTQVNVYPGGAFSGRFAQALSGSEVNFLGGGSGLAFIAGSGSAVNVYSGSIGFGLQAQGGSHVNISGGTVDFSFNSKSGSIVAISGGAFSNKIKLETGSQVTISGGDFQIDGVPIAGLGQIGNTAPLMLPTGSVFTGVFADGTPLAFSSLDSDQLADGVVTLLAATLPPAPAGTFIASIDGVPRGVRAGQTLIVDQGQTVGPFYNVAHGGTLKVPTGGSVAKELEAAGGAISVSGGNIGQNLDLFPGSSLNMSAGKIDFGTHVYAGSSLSMTGGTLVGAVVFNGASATIDGGNATISPLAGGQVTIHGGVTAVNTVTGSNVRYYGSDFRIDGVPVNVAGQPVGVGVNLPLNSDLSGVLADGQPFAIHNGFSPGTLSPILVEGTVKLFDQAPPPVTRPLVITSQDGPVQGARQGQRIIVDSAQGLLNLATLFYANGVQIVAGGSTGNGLNVVGTPVELDGGSIGNSFGLFGGATLTMRSGTTGYGNAYLGSRVVMADGSMGGLTVAKGASFYESGGSMPGLILDGSGVVTGGTLGPTVLIDDGGRLDMAGGSLPPETGTTPHFKAFAGSHVNLYGTEFQLNGAPLGLPYGSKFTISARGSQTVLAGSLLDGSALSLRLDISIKNDPACCLLFNYIDPNATLTVTLLNPGDYDRNGVVNHDDYVVWTSTYGATVAEPGDGADGNFDGVVDAADYTRWRDRMTATPGAGSGSGILTPEPGTMLLMLSGAVAFICSRRHTVTRVVTPDDEEFGHREQG